MMHISVISVILCLRWNTDNMTENYIPPIHSIKTTGTAFGIDEISTLTLEQRDYLNDVVIGKENLNDSEEVYNTAMSSTGPIILAILGILLLLPLAIIGVFILIAAIIWMAFRVMNRGHAYQRMKDNEKRLKELEARFKASIQQ